VFSLPLNTAQAGGKVPRDLVTLPYDISFIDFRDRVCVEMGLDPQEAELGYKFHNHRVRDSPIRLAKEDDLRVAISTAQGMVRRARSKEIHIIIHNLVCSTVYCCYNLLKLVSGFVHSSTCRIQKAQASQRR
jgi:hypothetical protein